MARIDELAAAAVRDGTVAGMTIAVARGRTIVLERHYGRADLALDTPLPENPVYEIGSVSKQFAAAAILRLAAAGKLALDDALAAHLPQFRFAEPHVTLRQLLHHTSGMKDVLRAVPAAQPLLTQNVSSEQLIATVEPEPFDFKPGEAMSYSNLPLATSAPPREISSPGTTPCTGVECFRPSGIDRWWHQGH